MYLCITKPSVRDLQDCNRSFSAIGKNSNSNDPLAKDPDSGSEQDLTELIRQVPTSSLAMVLFPIIFVRLEVDPSQSSQSFALPGL